MSVRIMAAIFEHSQLPTVPRFVLLALADHADHDGYAWPAVGRLAHKTGLTPRSVQRALAEAEAAGELIRTVGGGRHNTSLYQITVAVDKPGEKGDTVSPFVDEKGRQRARERVTESARKGDTVSPESSINHQEPRRESESAPRGAFVPAYEHPDVVPAAEVPARVAALRAGLTRRPTRGSPATPAPPDPPTLEVLEGDADGEGLA